MDTAEEKILRRIPLEILGLAMLGALIAWILTEAGFGLFVFLGGVLAALAFISLKHSITRVLGSDKKRAMRSAVLLYGLRLVLLSRYFRL